MNKKFKQYLEKDKRFTELFGYSSQTFSNTYLSQLTKYFIFDIVKFDEYIRNEYYGEYNIKSESLQTFIKRKFGTEAIELIEYFMNDSNNRLKNIVERKGNV